MSGITGRGGMGSHKHGTSGVAPKSPKARHRLKREAEADSIKPKKSTCVFGSIAEAMENR